MSDDNGFDEYKLMILDWHKQDVARDDRVDERLLAIEKAILTLQVKSSVWGGVAGFFAAAVVALVAAFLQRM